MMSRQPYKIRIRERINSSPKAGLRPSWVEYQVTHGKRVVFRCETQKQAERWMQDMLSKVRGEL